MRLIKDSMKARSYLAKERLNLVKKSVLEKSLVGKKQLAETKLEK